MAGPEMFDPMAIVAAFNRHGVEFVVIGGFAVELHRAPVRPTRDIDLTPATTSENLDRLSAALYDLGARIRTTDVPDGLAFSHDGPSLARAGVWNLVCEFGELDLSFQPSGTNGYEDLVRDAVLLEVTGQPLN
ncbi:MAG: nucleotidyl transferase AbiEii/AbiGii toxin family protein [Acidimicrobiales bacterium]